MKLQRKEEAYAGTEKRRLSVIEMKFPITWLVALVAGVLIQGGILWQQFHDLGEKVLSTAKVVEAQIEKDTASIEHNSVVNAIQDQRLSEHERRLAEHDRLLGKHQ